MADNLRAGSTVGGYPIFHSGLDRYNFNGNVMGHIFAEWDCKDLPSNVGAVVTDATAFSGLCRQATVAGYAAGYMTYGPYYRGLRFGKYVAGFRLKASANASASTVVTIDAWTGSALATLAIKGTDFTAANTWQMFYITFDYNSIGSMGLELRINFADVCDISADSIIVVPAHTAVYAL